MTPKQKRFCQEYLIDLSASQAAQRAGYAAKHANRIGHRLLQREEITLAIQQAMEARAAKTGIDAQWVLQRLAKIADFDIRKLFNKDGSLKLVTELDDETAFALGGIDVIELIQGKDSPPALLKKFKAIDKKGALELIGKHIGMFTEKIQVEQKQHAQVIITIPDNGRDPDLSSLHPS